MDPIPETHRADSPSQDPFKTPPHSLEAEQSVLGGLLLERSAWDLVADRITEEDFYRHNHQIIFRAIKDLHNAQSPSDVITVSERLEQTGNLQPCGGLAYLGVLANSVPSAANITAYADIVRERSICRQLIKVGSEISTSAFRQDGVPIKDKLDHAEHLIFEIAEHGALTGKGFEKVSDMLPQVVDRISELYETESDLTGLPTGFNDFDQMTAGLQNSDLVIIAGRPSMGKTALAMNVAENVAIQHKKSVAIFSMEMSSEQLVMRIISSLGRIDAKNVRTGKLGQNDWPRITSAISLLDEAPIYIDDTGALSPMELWARARRLKRRHGLDLIIVDYLQLMRIASNTENRATELSEISRTLKALAKELNIPVIALSQLNRSLEQRPNKRPLMSDLRESGAIEQDADLIVFIYRDEAYNPDSPDKGTAEIIIAKQRNGPTGMTKLAFLGTYARFEDFSSRDYARFEDLSSRDI